MNWRGPALVLAWLWWGELGLTSAHAEPPARAAAATPSTNDPPPAGTALERQLKRWLGAPQLWGQGTLRYFGFSIYQAQLWAGQRPPEAGLSWAQQPVLLSLHYQRDFKGEDIAQRSFEEMQRHPLMRASDHAAWLAALKALMPDVRTGERLIGVYQPGQGLQLWHDGASLRELGTAPDALMAQVFMGIWLDPSTSQPELRQRLLGLSKP
jgi:hypothetical protein